MKYITKSIWLLLFAVVICCGIYPAVLWAIGQTVFPFQANGSMVKDADGHVVGSLLIAQPFTKDEYFQPRPSACSYDASASSSSAIAASNYALRNRVATTLGPIVTYKGGTKDGKPVAPDIEAWFQQDQYQGGSNIVAQWADAHNSRGPGLGNCRSHPCGVRVQLGDCACAGGCAVHQGQSGHAPASALGFGGGVL